MECESFDIWIFKNNFQMPSLVSFVGLIQTRGPRSYKNFVKV